MKSEKLELLENRKEVQEEFDKIDKERDEKRSFTARLGFGSEEYKKIKEKRNKIQDKLSTMDDRIEEIDDALAGKVSFFQRFKQIKDSLSWSVIKAKASALADRIFNVIMLYIFQTILIPLGFLFALKYLIRAAWNAKLDLTDQAAIKQLEE